MLIQFSVQNFRSFRESQTLSLAAGNLTELPTNTFSLSTTEDLRLLRSAVIYGPNASGKSNLIRAVDFMRDMVTDSLEWAGASETAGYINSDPFRLDHKSASEPTTFEAIFIVDGVRYQYGFSVLNRIISGEWLMAYPNKAAQNWFVRGLTPDSWNFSPHLKGEKKRLVEVTRPDALFLSVAAQFNHQQLTPIYAWFKDRVQIIGTALANTEYTARRSFEDAEFHQLVANALKIADLGIADFKIDPPGEAPSDSLFETRKPADGTIARARRRAASVKTFHRILNPEKAVEFDLVRDESLGTRRFFGLIGRWVNALRTASVVFVDELDASMHPTLTRLLVTMFQDPKLNPRNAQAVVTTHDTTLLDNSIFRRDQVWFVQKDEESASRLYSLQDFHPRKDEALQKGYLAGRYGAMPFIGDLTL